MSQQMRRRVHKKIGLDPAVAVTRHAKEGGKGTDDESRLKIFAITPFTPYQLEQFK